MPDSSAAVAFNLRTGLDAQRKADLLAELAGAVGAPPPGDAVRRENFGTVLDGLSDRTRAAAEKLGVKFVGRGDALPKGVERPTFMAVTYGADGELHLVVGERALESIWYQSGYDPAVAERLVSAMLAEEMIHAAQLGGFRADWVAAGRTGDFDGYVRTRTANLLNDIVQLAKADDALAQTVQDAWRLYFDEVPTVSHQTLVNMLARLRVPKMGSGRYLLLFPISQRRHARCGDLSEAIWSGAWVLR